MQKESEAQRAADTLAESKSNANTNSSPGADDTDATATKTPDANADADANLNADAEDDGSMDANVGSDFESDSAGSNDEDLAMWDPASTRLQDVELERAKIGVVGAGGKGRLSPTTDTVAHSDVLAFGKLRALSCIVDVDTSAIQEELRFAAAQALSSFNHAVHLLLLVDRMWGAADVSCAQLT